jgi:hypothetical protein
LNKLYYHIPCVSNIINSFKDIEVHFNFESPFLWIQKMTIFRTYNYRVFQIITKIVIFVNTILVKAVETICHLE